MSSIAAWIGVFLVGLTLIGFGGMWYANFLMHVMVGKKHDLIDEITATGSVPEEWLRRYLPRMQKLQNEGRTQELADLHRAACKSYVRKVKPLIAYMRHTRLIESEEARKQTIRLLERAKAEWEDPTDHGFVYGGR